LTRQQFDASLTEAHPPGHLGPALSSLWWIANNHWQRAHDLIDGTPGPDAAWLHAHLHRVEGDQMNADYWYQRSGRDRPKDGISQERERMLAYFLAE
jgi:hypothetical protein